MTEQRTAKPLLSVRIIGDGIDHAMTVDDLDDVALVVKMLHSRLGAADEPSDGLCTAEPHSWYERDGKILCLNCNAVKTEVVRVKPEPKTATLCWCGDLNCEDHS